MACMAQSMPKILLFCGRIISTSTPRMAAVSSAESISFSGRKYGVTMLAVFCAQASAPRQRRSILP